MLNKVYFTRGTTDCFKAFEEKINRLIGAKPEDVWKIKRELRDILDVCVSQAVLDGKATNSEDLLI